MQRRESPSNLLKTGLLHGGASGFMGAALFTLIVLIILPVATTPEWASCFSCVAGWIVLVSIFAGLYGAIPAAVIGAISGFVMGWGFHLLQERRMNNKGLLFFVSALGLSVALPGMTLWIVFFLNDFQVGHFPSRWLDLQLLALLAPFCMFASIHVVWKLQQTASEKVAAGRNPSMVERDRK